LSDENLKTQILRGNNQKILLVIEIANLDPKRTVSNG
jgi:hypothetical protein